ncbi:DNA alkylation repair protein [Acaryochloris sp. CCMEE 5410]|uniref:DNA alkylation repair protein n=1 Tax=Acaryochloris sp. CCMEE 5410 TaxID=310037 RepID=UPI000248408E|nr:DNA alkylation repair protein [Acaryochloris sp. CCMEE 5410]KAI9132475.1 DNA alkylation repair protein [Acaryochloris sp. CCMEE 5410]
MANNLTAEAVHEQLLSLANPEIAEHSQRFFKTGAGEYGEGDQFLGIRVPVLRQQVTRYQKLPNDELIRLLQSPFHEERLFALLIWVKQFQTGSEKEQAHLYDLYLRHTQFINNWDLVDSSAYQIVGAFLERKDRQPIYPLAQSQSLWERRIAMMATFQWIRNHDFEDALAIAKLLLHDKEDLIHKAVGWMLREIGKRDLETEKAFLKAHYQEMPRTMLRYAIEKFPQSERQRYLKGLV